MGCTSSTVSADSPPFSSNVTFIFPGGIAFCAALVVSFIGVGDNLEDSDTWSNSSRMEAIIDDDEVDFCLGSVGVVLEFSGTDAIAEEAEPVFWIRPWGLGWNRDTGFSPASSGVVSSVVSLDPGPFFLSFFRRNILLNALRIDTPVKTDRRGVGGPEEEAWMVDGERGLKT